MNESTSIDLSIDGNGCRGYSICQEGTRMLVIPLPTACPVSPEGRGAQVRTAADSLKPQGQGQGSSLMPPLGTRRDVYSCTKDESRDKSSIFETMITAEPHGADRSTGCFCRSTHSPPMQRRFLQSKYSAQVPYSNEPTVAYVHPPMERPMER
jgi:hypothetical protein